MFFKNLKGIFPDLEIKFGIKVTILLACGKSLYILHIPSNSYSLKG